MPRQPFRLMGFRQFLTIPSEKELKQAEANSKQNQNEKDKFFIFILRIYYMANVTLN